MADFTQVKNDIDQLVRLQSTVQKDFLAAVKDENIPLDERWDLFVTAPEDLKAVKPWVWDSKSLGNNFNWYDDCSCERRETVNLIDFVHTLDVDIKSILARGDEGSHFSYKLAKKPGIIESLKEEIMQAGIRAFVFDW